MKSDRQNRYSTASSLNRRQFIAASAGVGAGLTIAPRLVFGAPGRPAPSDTVNLAFIGLGGQGKTNLKGFLGLDDVQVVALCDVAGENDYTPYYYRDKRAGLKPALEYVEQHYAEQIKSGIYQGCNTYVEPAARSATVVPPATAALNNLAPSRCSATPRTRASR
jgi:hypothetical protein